jgi:RNA polymerase sigma factor (sigma-70 family)
MAWALRPAQQAGSASDPPSDEQLRSLLERDREEGWRAFIDRYTPALLAFIERAGIGDRDEAMEIYVLACQRLAEHDCAALRRRDPSRGSLGGWLAVVVRRAVVDWIRSKAGRRRMFAAVRELDRFHQRLFELYYWEGRRPAEAAYLSSVEFGRPVGLEEVLDALERVESVLTTRHRADLLSLAARSRPALSLDDDGEDAPSIDVAAELPDPEAALHVRELEQRLTRALAALPAEDAAIVSLKFGEGLTRAEIQRLLRLPALTEHRVRAIVAVLRAQLADVAPAAVRTTAKPLPAAGGADD